MDATCYKLPAFYGLQETRSVAKHVKEAAHEIGDAVSGSAVAELVVFLCKYVP